MLSVGDEVIWRGRNGVPQRARVKAIDLCSRPGEKYGVPVNAVFEGMVNYCCVSLDNGHWAFGTDITLIERAERKAA